MHEGVRVGLEDRAEVGGRGDGGLHLGAVQPDDALFAAGGGILRPLVEPLELVRLGRHRERAHALPIGVDAPLGDVGAHRIEVRHAQVVELIDLVGPAAESVVASVGEARFAEAAVATGCRPPDRPRLDEGDAGVGVASPREQRRPQAGVAAAHDDQVGVVVAAQGGPAGLVGEVVEPEDALARAGEAALDDGCCRPLSLEDGRAHGYHFPVVCAASILRGARGSRRGVLAKTGRFGRIAACFSQISCRAAQPTGSGLAGRAPERVALAGRVGAERPLADDRSAPAAGPPLAPVDPRRPARAGIAGEGAAAAVAIGPQHPCPEVDHRGGVGLHGRRGGQDAADEEDLVGELVAEPGDVALVEQGDVRGPFIGSEPPRGLRGIPVRAERIGAEVADQLIFGARWGRP